MKTCVNAALFILALIASISSGWAQNYPTKPIRMIVPTAPGGSVDTLARIVGQKMSMALGAQIVVENRSGQAGVVGSDVVAKATPDGYVLLMAYGSHVINPSLYTKLPFDTVKSFAPITLVALQPMMLNVHSALPVKTVKQLIALAKARPGELNYASAGSGGHSHLAVEIMCNMAGVKMVHVVYRGSAPAMFDLIAGNTQLMVVTLIASLPHVRSGKLRGLAVTSKQRSPAVPEVPTIAETLPGYEVEASYFLLAPAGTSREIVDRLHDEAVRALKQPDVVERLARDGAVPVGNTPEETGQFIAQEIVKWGAAVKSSGARAD